jgi:hypothetical protein
MTTGDIPFGNNAAQIGAALCYDILMQPLSASFGELASVAGGTCANALAKQSGDPLTHEFARLFAQASEKHA